MNDQYDALFNPDDNGWPHGLDVLADGEYVFSVQSVEMAKTQNTQEDILRWVLRVVSGPGCENVVVEMVNFFRSQIAVNMLGADLRILGLPSHTWKVADGKPFSQMVAQETPGLQGASFRALKTTTAKNGREYHNLRIKSLVSAAPAEQNLENMPF